VFGFLREDLRIMVTEKKIQLDQFMKLTGLVGTGGQAKLVIQGGEVLVNGILETRRKKKLDIGDSVTFAGQTVTVTVDQLN
jgi:ribosome-associated protein